MTEVYLADVRPLFEEQAYLKLLPFVSADRAEKLQRYRRQEDRARGLGAGLLLEYGLLSRGYSLLSEDSGIHRAKLLYGVFGKPYLKGCGDIHFNLSHTGSYAAAVFSEAAVGIDIEQIKDAKPGLARRFFMEEEALRLTQCASQERPRAFTELWTRKESYIKAVGEGMRLPLPSFSVLSDEICAESVYYLYTFMPYADICLSVCGKRRERPAISEINLSKVFDGKNRRD